MQNPTMRKNLLVLGPAVTFVGGFLAGPHDWASQFSYGLIAIIIYAVLASAGALIVPAWRKKSTDASSPSLPPSSPLSQYSPPFACSCDINVPTTTSKITA